MNSKWSLKALRANRGLSQRQLAKELGISLSALRNYEQMKVIPNVKIAYQMADYFNVDLNTIIFFN